MDILVPAEEYAIRHQRVRERLAAENLDAVIAFSTAKMTGNVRYLSGYHVRFTGMQNQPDGEYHTFGTTACLFDGELASTAVRTDQDWDEVRAKELSFFDDTSYASPFAKDFGVMCRERKYKRVGIDHWQVFPAHEYLTLRELAPETEFVPTVMLSEARRIKTPWEIAIMRRSAAAAVHGVTEGLKQVGVGAMEYDIVMQAEWSMREKGDLELGGQSIAGCGPRTASGSGAPSSNPRANNAMKPGEWYMLDICPRVDGYAGDMSRHKVAGALSDVDPLLLRAYETTREIGDEVRAAIRPGVTGRELTKIADDIAAQAGFGDNKIDLLGHGVGLDIHDIPDYYWDDSPLSAGEIITVEPCLLLPGKAGARIEDMVLVTEDGHEVLTDMSRELTAEI